MIKKCTVLLILIFLVVSCGKQQSQTEKQFDKVKKELLEKHDVLMKEMETIGALIQKVESKIDTTDGNHNFENVAAQLKHAHAFMFSWMNSFHEDFPEINNSGKNYTEAENKTRLERIKGHQNVLLKVQEEVENSIADARHVLAKAKKAPKEKAAIKKK